MSTYIDSFIQTARKNADKTALVDLNGTRRMTYGELLDMSGRVAAKLLARNYADGTPIIINMERRRD